MSDLKKLTSHEFHLAKGAKFTAFAGWNMPVSYGSSLSEHLSVRESVGLFDVSHMGEIEVTGPQSVEFLNYALTNDIEKCKIGQAQYTILCQEDGGTLDDLIVYRRAEQSFLLCVNASNVENDYQVLSERSSQFECDVINLSSSFGQLALQGPHAEKILNDVIGQNLSSLSKMHFLEGLWLGDTSILARTGYTGEDGFEIYTSLPGLNEWLNAFDQLGVPMIGLAARDSLRLEAGFPLYGHELSHSISPVQAGLAWAVGWEKDEFCGKQALLKEKKNHPSHRVGYFIASDRRIPREGCPILNPADEEVGLVLSGGFSPLHEKPMGTALIGYDHWESRNDCGWHALLRNQKVPIEFGLAPLRRARS
jgi:aminomethyltransferase